MVAEEIVVRREKKKKKKGKFLVFSSGDRFERQKSLFCRRRRRERRKETTQPKLTVRRVRDADVGLGPLEQLALAISQLVLRQVSTSASLSRILFLFALFLTG
jgi:predicted sugar kinase